MIKEEKMLSKKEIEPAANSGEINAFLGKGTDFNGKLTFVKERLIIIALQMSSLGC